MRSSFQMFMLFGGLVADDNYFVCSSNKFTALQGIIMCESPRKRKNLSNTMERRSSSRKRVENKKYKDYRPVEDLFSNQWSSVASSSRKIPKSNNLEYQQNVPANEDLPMPLALVAHSPETPCGNSTAAKAKGVQVADTSDAVESEKGSPLRVSLCTLADRFEFTASTLSFTTSRIHSVSPKAKTVVQKFLDLLEVNLKDFSNEQFEEFAGLVDSIRNLDILEEHQRDVLLDMSTQLPGIVAELQTREAVLENAKEIMINLEEYLELSKQEKELRRCLQECLTKKEEVMKRRDELNAKKSELMEEFPGSDARSNMAAMSSLEAAWYFCKTSLGRILKFVK